MKTEDFENVKKDLEEIIKKYSLKNCAFCGNDEDQQCFATLLQDTPDEKMPIDRLWLASLNVGRLWQHTREMVRRAMHAFEINGSKGTGW